MRNPPGHSRRLRHPQSLPGGTRPGPLTRNVSRRGRESVWEPALGGRGPAGWPRPISGVSDLTVAARGQPPPGWEHLPHGHDLSGLISPPRAGCRPWTSTSHRGDNSEKSVLRCGVVGEGSWTSHRRGDIGAGPCRWRSDPCAWPASAHGLRSVPPFFYRWIVGLSLGPGPDETW